tara:strand:+ start:3574 stop:4293 length:720 start_codon:yes stop_codon:yes gene_type:complete
MGFLDNSTNNVIVDAVLTDLGRSALARNDGSFSIAKYTFGDDEVDYGIITRFGRTVGKEKIIKNTPVLDANTNSTVALKNRLITLSIPTLDRVPIIQLSAASDLEQSDVTPVLSITKGKSATITLTQTIINEDRVPSQLVDTAFFVQVDNRFLTINNTRPSFVDTNNVATYNVLRGRAGKTSTKGGAVQDFTFRAKSVADSKFNTFGNVTNKSIITTTARIVGAQSGVVEEIQIQLKKS